MKKHLPSLLLCAVLALVCTSCSSGTTTQNSSTPSSAVSAESTASETSDTASQTVSDNTSHKRFPITPVPVKRKAPYPPLNPAL